MLQLQKITFSYTKEWTLDNISLALTSGEMMAIVGPNGCGKSTLMKIMAGLFLPQKGQVLLNNTDINSFSRKKLAQIIGYLPQTITSDFDFTVYDVVSMGRFAHQEGLGFLAKEDCTIIHQCLEATQTATLSQRKISMVSGGELQRVFLASVLAQRPKILLLDEPTTGLDLHHQIELFTLLKQLCLQQIAVVLVTHEINLAALYAKRIVLLNKGQLVIDSTPQKAITQENIEKIYGKQIYVGYHPKNKIPMLYPLCPSIDQN